MLQTIRSNNRLQLFLGLLVGIGIGFLAKGR